jgi:hypothetical protein
LVPITQREERSRDRKKVEITALLTRGVAKWICALYWELWVEKSRFNINSNIGTLRISIKREVT